MRIQGVLAHKRNQLCVRPLRRGIVYFEGVGKLAGGVDQVLEEAASHRRRRGEGMHCVLRERIVLFKVF